MIRWIAPAFLVCGTGVAADCPDTTLPAAQTIAASAVELFGGRSLEVVAGGDTPLARCPGLFSSGAVITYIVDQPDFQFVLSGVEGRSLEFRTRGECDTQLLVLGASWQYFDDDDGEGLNARIVVTQPRSGTYAVWVGHIDGTLCETTLIVETSGS